MTTQDNNAQRHMGVLYREHVLLGARFEASGQTGVLGVGSYASGETDARTHLREGALLADLTGATYLLVSGAAAQALVESAFCGRRLAVGECAWEPALTGDAALVSIAVVARTGDAEYVVCDPSPRADALAAWLGFLANIEQGDERAFPGTTVEPAHMMLVPLALSGAEARSVLADYVRNVHELPREGRVASVSLDAIATVVAHVPAALDTYLVLAPPPSARPLWRSFLSFGQVTPVGLATAEDLVMAELPWGGLLSTPDDAVRPTRAQLAGWGLLREGDDFVGARGLTR